MKKRNLKKGFSLVECVVAIAVILVISSSAIIIFQAATRSTDSQWHKYRINLDMQNILSAFQACEDIDTFNGVLGLNSANEGGEIEEETTTVATVAGARKYDLSNAMLSTDFTEVRAYGPTSKSDAHIDFYAVDEAKGEETLLVSFVYEDAEEYNSAKSRFNAGSASSIWGSSGEESTGTGSDTSYMKLSYSWSNGSESYAGPETISVNRDNTGTVSFGDIGTSTDLTEFDKFLFENAWYVVPVGYESAKAGDTTVQGIVFEVREASNARVQQVLAEAVGDTVQSATYYLDYVLWGNWANFNGNANSVTISDVDKRYVPVNAGDGQQKDEDFTAYKDTNWTWASAWLAGKCYVNRDSESFSWSDFASKFTCAEFNSAYRYGWYKLKEIDPQKEENYGCLTYALFSDTQLWLYSKPNGKAYTSTTEEQGQLLFLYAGTKITDAVKDLTNNCGFAMQAEKEGNLTKFCKLSSEVVITRYDTGETSDHYEIYFSDGRGTDDKSDDIVVIRFQYDKTDISRLIYEEDLKNLTEVNGLYFSQYNANGGKPNRLLQSGAPILYRTATDWQLHVKVFGNSEEDIVFSSGANTITQTTYRSFTNVKGEDVGEQGLVKVLKDETTYTGYFYKQYGDKICYIRVIYAQFVADSEESSETNTSNPAESKLTIWILTEEELNNILNYGLTELPDEAYIEYRKG